MNVSLKNDWAEFIDAKVKNGEYDTASEVVRAGLRLLKREEDREKALLEALRVQVADGVAQAKRGDGRPASEVFKDLFSHIDAQAAAEA